MKTIGMIGSVSWQATIEYYRIINEMTTKRLGGLHSAKLIIACKDFEELVQFAKDNDWDGMANSIAKEVQKLEKSGADFFLICANTLHKITDRIAAQVGIPILNIVEVTAQKVKEKNIKKVALLGTSFTMEDGFYQKIMDKYGIEIIVPDKTDRQYIHDSIFKELNFGLLKETTRREYIRIIESQIKREVEGIILGCTEIPLLIKQEHVSIPIFDTTSIHAEAAAELALG